MMGKNEISRETRKRIEKTVNYILKDLQNDLSLTRLSEIASYSPYHFQRIFVQVMGESPKQYVARMRLETAAHYLVIHGNKSVHVIAMECGFSSPAVFARAFKKYFGLTAEAFREAPPGERVKRMNGDYFRYLAAHSHAAATGNDAFSITVKTLPVQYGVCINSNFDSSDTAMKLINEMIVLARSHDLVNDQTKIIGIMYPHHNIYRAFLTCDPRIPVPAGFNRAEIKGGKFAVMPFNGSFANIFEFLELFYQEWLPENGYKLAEIYGFELFPGIPSGKRYEDIHRELYIPIEPV